MKKILLLGGSAQQIPAIKYAKSQGYTTVLCDFLSDNPGQYFVDKFYCVSTTEKEMILKVAQKEKVDGVVGYASDPASPTAAYTAEKMGLPTNPYKSVEILAYKDEFRKFLKDNNFNCPRAQSFPTFEKAKESIDRFRFPVIVKPIDSSGSKGVKKLESLDELEVAFNLALTQSKGKKVIIEEFITRDHKYMIGGDCFVLNGKVAFWGLLNCHRDLNVNPLVPVGKSYPVQVSKDRIQKIKKEVQQVVDLLDIKFGGFNLEIMFDDRGELYLIEMGPRNGGNMIPDLLHMITGIDLISATVEVALGNYNINLNYESQPVFYATYNLHTAKDGIFKGIEFNNDLKSKIIREVIYKKKGDLVQYFDGAHKAIGIVFMKFTSINEMLDVMDNAGSRIQIILN